jgi:hypothetical protein
MPRVVMRARHVSRPAASLPPPLALPPAQPLEAPALPLGLITSTATTTMPSYASSSRSLMAI